MPFTPFHMGPGLALKAIGGRHFSLITFSLAQVVMDIEPLINLMRGAEVVHGSTHSYAAAVLIAALVALASPRISRPILRAWNREIAFHRLGWLAAPESLETIPAITGAFAGTLSHVLLDSLMHADMAPLAPWAASNTLLGLISNETLHQLCVLAGALGLVGWLAMSWRKRPVTDLG